MYCASCGRAVGADLTYCNHCGARLGSAKAEEINKTPEWSPDDSLIWAIVSVFIVGLGCLIGLMAVMKDYAFTQGTILAFCSMIFLMLIAVEAVFISMLWRRRAGKRGDDSEKLGGRATQQLGPARQQALPEPLPSITEHTTRTFEPVISEPAQAKRLDDTRRNSR